MMMMLLLLLLLMMLRCLSASGRSVVVLPTSATGIDVVHVCKSHGTIRQERSFCRGGRDAAINVLVVVVFVFRIVAEFRRRRTTTATTTSSFSATITTTRLFFLTVRFTTV